MKIKAEASGFPGSVKTEVEKLQYIEDYEHNEGIKLDLAKIKKNPGLRALAKMCLNSLWGKFGQRLNLTKTIITESPAKFFEILTDKTLIAKDFNMISDDYVMLHYEEKKEFINDLGSTNIYLAAFTTSHARLKLYNELDRLDRNCLYCDTDSVIWVKKPNTYQPITGEYLGMLKNELKPNEIIITGIFPGPKSYAYVTSLGTEEIKCKGFTLNHKNEKLINFNSLSYLVHSFCNDNKIEEIVTENEHKITRDKKKMQIYNKSISSN